MLNLIGPLKIKPSASFCGGNSISSGLFKKTAEKLYTRVLILVRVDVSSLKLWSQTRCNMVWNFYTPLLLPRAACFANYFVIAPRAPRVCTHSAWNWRRKVVTVTPFLFTSSWQEPSRVRISQMLQPLSTPTSITEWPCKCLELCLDFASVSVTLLKYQLIIIAQKCLGRWNYPIISFHSVTTLAKFVQHARMHERTHAHTCVVGKDPYFLSSLINNIIVWF